MFIPNKGGKNKERQECLNALKQICDKNKLDKNLIKSFVDIFFSSNLKQLNQKYIFEISNFFKPTAKFFSPHQCDQQKYNNYTKICGESVINLRKFLENHNGKENGLFEFILRILSYLRSISKSSQGYYPTNIKKSDPKDWYQEHSTVFCNSPRYGEIYKKVKEKCNGINDCKERFNFPGLTLSTCNSVEQEADGMWILNTKVKFNSSDEITITKIKFWDVDGWNKYESKMDLFNQVTEKVKFDGKTHSTAGKIYHTKHKNISQIIKLLSILFNICIAPIPNKSDAAKVKKIREISLFEWILQQSSPFVRGTPTNAKILISAILLKHGFIPNYHYKDNDKNCLYSFMLTPSEYLHSWMQHTPYVDKTLTFSHLIFKESIDSLKHLPQSSMKEMALNHKKICWCFKKLDEEMEENKGLFASKYFPFFNSNGQFKINNDFTNAHKNLDGIIFLQNKLLKLLQEQLPKLKYSQLKYIQWYIGEVIHKKPHALRLKRKNPQATINRKNLNKSFHKYYCFGDTEAFTRINRILDKEIKKRTSD